MQAATILPLDLYRFPLSDEKVQKLKPKLSFDKKNSKFKLLINILGYRKDDIKVFAGMDTIMVKAVDRAQMNSVNVCKVYEAEYMLPPGIAIERISKSFSDGVLCVRGDVLQDTKSGDE